MNTDPEQFARAVADAARQMNSRHDLTSTLQAIVETAQRSLPCIDHAGISLTHRDGRVETLAATDELVFKLDSLQYDLNEGPCLDAIRAEPVVPVNNIRHEQRWPRYIPAAVSLGLRAQLGVRLFDSKTLGGLNLYSTQSDVIAPETLILAELLATQAAIALGHARQEESLNQALFTRKIIGQAIGILMGRYELDEDHAFAFLTRVSQDTNMKLRDVAAKLVDSTNADNTVPAKRMAEQSHVAHQGGPATPRALNEIRLSPSRNNIPSVGEASTAP